jgi:REP element-mobilizing transposase RayT
MWMKKGESNESSCRDDISRMINGAIMSRYNPDIHHRRSIRLKNYDYSQAGAYFVTICVKHREQLFGQIQDGTMQLNQYGKIATEWWEQIPNHFPNAELDACVIMPNHMHGIIAICDDTAAGGTGGVSPPPPHAGADIIDDADIMGGAETAPLRAESPRRTLGQMVAYYKYQVTKTINQERNTPGVKIWQRNYYEHIIRNQRSLRRICEYIMNNPKRWDIDQLHPNVPSQW